MAVYSRVIGAGADTSLTALLSGAAIVLVLMLVLRHTRNRTIAAAQPRLSATFAMALVARYLRLAGRRPSLDGARAQMRLGARAADLFSSQNLTALFDAPFIVLTLVAMAFVGGWMVIIPLVYLALFLGFGLYVSRLNQGLLPAASRGSADKSARLDELVHDTAAIRETGSVSDWMARFDQTARQSAMNTHKAQRRSAGLQAVGYVLGTGTALITLIVGLDLVLRGDLVPGTLIGTMLLTWRVTGPAQALFLGLPRISGLRNAWSQLAATLRAPTLSARAHLQRDLQTDADLTLSGVGLYHRFPGAARPALTGVSFDIPQGSSVVVIGPNGSGKSVLLKILTGRMAPQSGALMIAGASAEQFTAESLAARMELSESVAALAPEALARKDLIALDTPCGPGEIEARTAIVDALAAPDRKATIVIATHDTTLAEVADLAIVLDKGGLAYFGPIRTPKADADAQPTAQSDQEIPA